MKPILAVAALLLLLGNGCDPASRDDNLGILVIGPYTQTCQGFIEQTCFLEYNDDSRQWEFFYEEIQGFDFEPGFLYTLEARLEDRGTDIQDVGRYAYHLVDVLSRREVSEGSYSTGFVVDGERLYAESEAPGEGSQ